MQSESLQIGVIGAGSWGTAMARLLFKNGNVAATKVGALSKAQLTEFLNENL